MEIRFKLLQTQLCTRSYWCDCDYALKWNLFTSIFTTYFQLFPNILQTENLYFSSKFWFGTQTNLRNAFKFLVSLEKGLSFDERLSNTSVFQKKCFPMLLDPLYYLKTHNKFYHFKLHQNGAFNCTFKVEVFYCNAATDKQDNVRI